MGTDAVPFACHGSGIVERAGKGLCLCTCVATAWLLLSCVHWQGALIELICSKTSHLVTRPKSSLLLDIGCRGMCKG